MTNTGQKQCEGLKHSKITKNHLLDILKGGAFAPVGLQQWATDTVME